MTGARLPGLALFGGAFNPPHVAHERIVREALQRLPVDRLVVLPSGRHPWKADDQELAPAVQRLELCRIAFASIPGAEVSDHETTRASTTYTVDTLGWFARTLPEGRTLDRLIGSDNLPTLHKWERVHEVLRLATVVTYPRAGHPCDERTILALDLEPAEKRTLADHVLDVPADGVSSSDLRRRLGAGLRVDDLVNPRVLARIHELGLYGDMIALPPAAIIAISATAVGAALLVHRRVRAFLPEDPPGARKLQPEPMAMIGCVLGQLVLAAGLLAGTPWYLWLGLGLVLLVGSLDDYRKAGGGVGWLSKAAFLAAAALLVAVGTAPPGQAPSLLECLGRAAFAFVIVNAVNFLDNTNGVLVAVAALPLVLAAEPLPGGDFTAFAGWVFCGYLPFNWPRARCLAGDAGAYTLGVILAWKALSSPSAWHGCALTLVPLVDFVQVVAMRLFLGFAPWIADRRHLPHIAMNLGLPPWLVAPVFAGAVWGGMVGLRALSAA